MRPPSAVTRTGTVALARAVKDPFSSAHRVPAASVAIRTRTLSRSVLRLQESFLREVTQPPPAPVRRVGQRQQACPIPSAATPDLPIPPSITRPTGPPPPDPPQTPPSIRTP